MVAITALNGRIPTGTLVTIDRAGHQLRADAAAALDRLSVAMVSAGHGPIVLSAGFSAYRTLADQQHMISLGLTTMPAGQSQHGEAVAADIAYLGGFAGARYRWLAEHGREYGWAQPKWATAKGSLPESWHWEYNPDDDQHATPAPTAPAVTEEDDMPYTEDQLRRMIRDELRTVLGLGGANLPKSETDKLPSVSTLGERARVARDEIKLHRQASGQ